MSDEDVDVALARRSITFWMTLSRSGLDVELWFTKPRLIDFGGNMVDWLGELPEGGSSFAARWPVGRAQLTLGSVPATDRECLKFSSERAR